MIKEEYLIMDYTIFYQYIFMVICFIIGLFFIITNARIFWRNYVKKQSDVPYVSENPLIGGIFTALAILLIPNNEWWYLCFIPLLLDWGCVPLIIRIIIFCIKHRDWLNKR